MKKNISKLGAPLSKDDQKKIHGGLLPVGDCCPCVYVPQGEMFPIFITQSCQDPCPVDGDPRQFGNGC
jgi:hypothetical protein